jgi:membrane protease YdiL (CAAX protease family)
MDIQQSKTRARGLILGETAILYFILWMDLYVPILSYPPFTNSWLFASVFKNILRIVAMYFFVFKSRGFAAYGLTGFFSRPRHRDVTWALLIALSATALMILSSLAGGVFGNVNPLFASVRPVIHPPLYFLGLGFMSLSVGYSEELFFRFFAQKNIESAGFSPIVGVVVSSAVFGLSHGAQGIFGIIVSFVLGCVFSWFRLRGKTIHALAIGHALYDFAVLVAFLGGIFTGP